MNKKTVKHIIIFGISMALILGLYLVASNIIVRETDKKYFSENENIGIDNNVAVEIQEVKKQDTTIKMNGWITIKNAVNRAIDVILREVDSEEYISVKANLYNREDIVDYYGLSSASSKCGFEVDIKEDKLEKNEVYEILVSVRYSNVDEKNKSDVVRKVKRVTTKQYLYDGEIYPYNPLAFYEPEVTNAEFNEVIIQGTVKAFDDEKNAWIYEYGRKLYMIVDYGVIGEVAQQPKVPVFIYTLKKDNALSSEGIEEIVRKDFYVSEEQINERDGEYVLMTVDLADVYQPITFIKMGVFGGKENNKMWNWVAEFRPEMKVD